MESPAKEKRPHKDFSRAARASGCGGSRHDRIPVFEQLLLCQPLGYISNMVSLETSHG